MSKKGRHSKGAMAISDRSGFEFPMSEMVIEPGTNWLVHRSESDGRWSEQVHPLNNLSRYLRGKQGDPYPVRNARPEQEINAVPNYKAVANFFNNINFRADGNVLNTGIAQFEGSSSASASGNLTYRESASFTGQSSFTTNVLPFSLQEVVPTTLIDIDMTRTDSVNGTNGQGINLVNPWADNFDIQGVRYNNLGTPSGNIETNLSTAKMTFTSGDSTFVKGLHKSNNASWWIAASLRYTGTGLDTVFSTIDSFSGEGVELLIASNSDARFNVDRSNSRIINYFSYRPTGSEDTLFIVSYNHLTDEASIWVRDTRPGVTSVNETVNFPDVHPLTSTVDATLPFTVFSRDTGAVASNIGTKLYGIALGNSFLSNSEVETLVDTISIRQNRNYT